LDILTIGGLLVEIMRKETDKPFDSVADLIGPFPSGDVGIFVDVAARMGGNAGIIGVVGDDGFGKCIMNRLKKDGVDTSMVSVCKGATTGVAFVAYFGDGSRNFIYHWRDAAAGMIDSDMITPEFGAK
jgi:sugar/nucleoside kinase (ribokinase family)